MGVAAFLWLAPLVPFVAALYVAFSGLPLARGLADGRAFANPRNVSLGASAAALALVLVHTAELGADSTRALVSHAWGILRIGSVDAGFTLVLEPSTAVLAIAVSAVAIGVLVTQSPSSVDNRAICTGVSLAHAGMLLVILGNDWVLAFAGSNLVGVGAYSMFASRDDAGQKQLFLAGRVGDAAILAGSMVLLWGLGGGWTGDGDYVPDFRPRVVGVQRGDPSVLAPKEPAVRPRNDQPDATLSTAAFPGATLSLGGAELCEVDREGKPGGLGTVGRPCTTRARSPIAGAKVPAALHDIRFHTGPGTHDFVVEKVHLDSGRETLLAITGATLSLRDGREQLLMRDQTGAYPLRAGLAKRKFFSLPLLGVIAGLFAFGTLVRVLFGGARFASAINSRASAMIVASEMCVGVMLLTRADFVFGLVPGVSAITALVAAIGAVLLALRALHAEDTRSAIVDIAASGYAVVIAGVALAGHAPGVTTLAVTALSAAGLLVALGVLDASKLSSSAGLVTRFPALKPPLQALAVVLAGAPVPLAFARAGVVEDIARAEAFGMPVGWLLAALVFLASGCAAFAVWRVTFVLCGEPQRKKKPITNAAGRGVAFSLALVGALVSLAAIPRGVLGGAPALLDHWLTLLPIEEMAAPGAPVDSGVRLGLLAATLVVAVVGFVLARARYVKDDWRGREGERVGHAFFAAKDSYIGSKLLLPFTLLADLAARLDSIFERTALGMQPADLDEDGGES